MLFSCFFVLKANLSSIGRKYDSLTAWVFVHLVTLIRRTSIVSRPKLCSWHESTQTKIKSRERESEWGWFGWFHKQSKGSTEIYNCAYKFFLLHAYSVCCRTLQSYWWEPAARHNKYTCMIYILQSIKTHLLKEVHLPLRLPWRLLCKESIYNYIIPILFSLGWQIKVNI